MTPAEELERVRAGAGGGPPPPGADRVEAECPGGADAVLARVREVLLAVLPVAPGE